MLPNRGLKPIKSTELLKKRKKSERYEARFEHKKREPGSMKADMSKWLDSRHPPMTVPKSKEHKVKAVRFKERDLQKLDAIHRSKSPSAEAVYQKVGPDDLFGITYSTLTIHEFLKLKEEYSENLEDATTPQEKAKVKKEWKDIVKAAGKAFARGGLRGLKEKDLDDMGKVLKKHNEFYETVDEIAKSGKRERSLSMNPDYAAAIVPVATELLEPLVVELDKVTNLCTNPIEDQFVATVSYSFGWSVRLKVWCPVSYNPFRFCWTTFTLAGVSVSFALDVGYRISCTGAVAWGIAEVQACATILGIRLCAVCTATVNGVLGFNEIGDSGTCLYGAGLSAGVVCTFAGIPIFMAEFPIGLSIEADCPDIDF